jgi:phospholipase/lecithinase/hemolysin
VRSSDVPVVNAIEMPKKWSAMVGIKPKDIVFLLLGIFATTNAAAQVTTVPIREMYVLGDSLSDQGNLFLASTTLGPAFGVPPFPDASHYYAGRFANGENYAGQLARLLGFRLNASLAGGNNFAFGGARTSRNVVEPPTGLFPAGAYPWSLDLQREAFLASVHPKAADPTALYVVFSGANDIGDILLFGLDPATEIARTVGGIRNVILAFRSVGARHILVPNVPNLGLAPIVTSLGPGASAAATTVAAAYNMALDAMLDEFGDVNIIRFDTFGLITDIVANPASYGLSNVTDPCYTGYVAPNPLATECATPDTHAFWDIEHPTRALHAILAREIFTSALHCEPNRGNHPNDMFVTRCAVNAHSK